MRGRFLDYLFVIPLLLELVPHLMREGVRPFGSEILRLEEGDFYI